MGPLSPRPEVPEVASSAGCGGAAASASAAAAGAANLNNAATASSSAAAPAVAARAAVYGRPPHRFLRTLCASVGSAGGRQPGTAVKVPPSTKQAPAKAAADADGPWLIVGLGETCCRVGGGGRQWLNAYQQQLQRPSTAPPPPHKKNRPGNPGPRYERTRHNVGFMVVDALARAEGIDLRKLEKSAAVGRGEIAGRKVLLVKPVTFMVRARAGGGRRFGGGRADGGAGAGAVGGWGSV